MYTLPIELEILLTGQRFNISGPAYQVLPDFLGENKYQTRTAGNAWQKANNTDLEFFPWAKQYPEKLTWFQSLMSVPRDGDWLDMVDFTEAAASVVPDRALFVDVGGSIGHQCMRLKARYPCVPGRIIVQDLEESVKAAQPIEGVEFMVHNFFNPQPIKGIFNQPLRCSGRLANTCGRSEVLLPPHRPPRLAGRQGGADPEEPRPRNEPGLAAAHRRHGAA